MIYVPPKRRAIYPRCDRCGKLKWSMGSHLSAVGAGCCCDTGCPSCTNCPESSMPCSFDVTFTGVTNCDCNTGGSSAVYVSFDSGETVNSTWTVTQDDSDPCKYVGLFDDVITETRYDSGTSCTGSVSGTTSRGFVVELRFFSSGSNVVAQIIGAAADSSGDIDLPYYIGCVTQSACDTNTGSISNVLSESDCYENNIIGGGFTCASGDGRVFGTNWGYAGSGSASPS